MKVVERRPVRLASTGAMHAIHRVIALHEPADPRGMAKGRVRCRECGFKWPCLTRQILTGSA